MNKLKRRIIDISYKNKLSHIGSCLSVVEVIDQIYDRMKPEDKFVLSAGHSHLAHLVVREKLGQIDNAEDYIYDIHCNRQAGCDVSTGSLGQGLPIALGMALARKDATIYCVISDGECSEGSIWEALRIADELDVKNLEVHAYINDYAAYKQVDIIDLITRLNHYSVEIHITGFQELMPYLREPQEGHYKILNKEEYEDITGINKDKGVQGIH